MILFNPNFSDANFPNICIHLIEGRDCIAWYDNQQLQDIVEYLSNGAGVEGVEFIPNTAFLYVSPLVRDSLPQDIEILQKWPDERFGYSLESANQSGETIIYGEELQFAWMIVNSPSYIVESNGNLYVISVIVPNISLFGRD